MLPFGCGGDSEGNSIRYAKLSIPINRRPEIQGMRNQSIRTSSDQPAYSWSNRILILATAGILFLTLYPFRLNFHILPGGASPFLLGRSFKTASSVDGILNVLLFVPFGFGLTAKMRSQGMSARRALVTALAAGALLSYTIEFLQLYIPERDSGWEDVFTNGGGALLGSMFYLLAGGFLLRAASSAQDIFRTHLQMKGAVAAVLVYLFLWFGIAAELQKQTRLSNWKPDAMLVLGNDGMGEEPWRGEIQSLQIWDTTRENSPPLIDYDFSRTREGLAGPKFIPNLFWIPRAPAERASSGGLLLNGTSWTSTEAHVDSLIDHLQRTNQFAIRIVFTPADVQAGTGRIVSISNSSGDSNLTLRQEKGNIYFWFRTPLAMKRALLEWHVPAGGEHAQRDLLYSYDGANLHVIVDGKNSRLAYPLGPGAGMARLIHTIRPSELRGINYFFYAMIFLAGGALFGLLSVPSTAVTATRVFTLAVAALLLFSFLLDFILVAVSGRPLSFGRVALSCALGIAGYLWARSDEPLRAHGGAL